MRIQRGAIAQAESSVGCRIKVGGYVSERVFLLRHPANVIVRILEDRVAVGVSDCRQPIQAVVTVRGHRAARVSDRMQATAGIVAVAHAQPARPIDARDAIPGVVSKLQGWPVRARDRQQLVRVSRIVLQRQRVAVWVADLLRSFAVVIEQVPGAVAGGQAEIVRISVADQLGANAGRVRVQLVPHGGSRVLRLHEVQTQAVAGHHRHVIRVEDQARKRMCPVVPQEAVVILE